jgi:2,4-dienoyl-CoA reductase-like NADH-dependent reductase (Old Yellow Enzyme family)
MSQQPTLADPLVLGSKTTIRNRFLKSAMSEQLGDRDHAPTEALARLYRTWAEGGTGLSVTGNVMIDRRHLGEPANVVLEDDRHMAEFSAWAEAAATDGCSPWMQLNHPGKQSPSFLTREPVAPSAVPLGQGLNRLFNTPRALTDREIREIVERFAAAAALAREAGFAGVQIHGAHGYLVSQFLSPRHNRREDDWGGSAERRRRFVLEVFRAIRAATGDDYPVGIKLNSADFMRGGFTEDESLDAVRALAEEGIDLIEISGGSYESPAMVGHRMKDSTRQREAYFLAFAERCRAVVETPLAVTGGFRTRSVMDDALASGATDLIGLARPLAVEPTFPERCLDQPDATIDLPSPTTGLRSVDRMFMLSLTWYEQQLHLMGAGRDPVPKRSAWRSVWSTASSLGLAGLRKRRA